MKRNYFISFLAATMAFSVEAIAEPASVGDYLESSVSKYEFFIKHPDKAREKDVLDSFIKISETQARKLLQEIYRNDGFRKADMLAKKGNYYILDFLVNVARYSDGEIAEAINVTLGQSSETAPRNFLRVVTDNNSENWLIDAVTALDPSTYAEKFRERIDAYTKRKRTLATIKEPTLLEARDKCIRQLEKEILAIQQIIQHK